MTEKRIALFSCLFLWKIQFKEKKLLKEREVSIITNGGFEVKQMSAAEREAFMSALLERVLELRRKRKEVDSHAT
jgi:acetolactate synthase regulatory subunit